MSRRNPFPKIQTVPGASSGLAASHTISASTTNSTLISAGAHKVYSIIVNNVNAAVVYLKLYDKATAPTVGTDTPIATLAVPTASVQKFDFAGGLEFLLGIGFGLTTAPADSSTAAVTANEQVVNCFYL